MIRTLAAFIVFGLVVGCSVYVAAGRGARPSITIEQPDQPVGKRATIALSATAPGGSLSGLTIALEQNGRTLPLFSLDHPQDATIVQSDAEHLGIFLPFGTEIVPGLQPGAARLVVTASRRSFLNLRALSVTVAKAIEIRPEPPRAAKDPEGNDLASFLRPTLPYGDGDQAFVVRAAGHSGAAL